MYKIAFLGAYLAFMCVTPEQAKTRIYYADTSHLSDGEIWGSELLLFFSKDNHIRVTTSYSRGLAKELLRVKRLLAKTKANTEMDDYPYDYAFILRSNDTLYTDSNFRRWRSGTKRALIASPINAYVSTAFAR
jgi:hypothetical protein